MMSSNLIDLELMLNQLHKWLAKEKSLRGRIHLENAINALSEYLKIQLEDKNE